jgi:hypothetical protein
MNVFCSLQFVFYAFHPKAVKKLDDLILAGLLAYVRTVSPSRPRDGGQWF